MQKTHHIPQLSRRHFLKGSIITAASTVALSQRGLAAPSERINAAIIGLGVRGKRLAKQAVEVNGVNITWLVDPDISRANVMKELAPNAKTAQDLREALDDPDVDVVIIATCNHWHCLAAIWACQAGKDVYVEKPLGHNVAEQQRLIEISEATNRIIQVGTQQRSDHVQEEIRQFLHEEKGLGEIQYIRSNRYGVRPPVPKIPNSLKIPDSVDYDL